MKDPFGVSKSKSMITGSTRVISGKAKSMLDSKVKTMLDPKAKGVLRRINPPKGK